jgi:hypothetical protein
LEKLLDGFTRVQLDSRERMHGVPKTAKRCSCHGSVARLREEIEVLRDLAQVVSRMFTLVKRVLGETLVHCRKRLWRAYMGFYLATRLYVGNYLTSRIQQDGLMSKFTLLHLSTGRAGGRTAPSRSQALIPSLWLGHSESNFPS